jgi:hypothetical protein
VLTFGNPEYFERCTTLSYGIEIWGKSFLMRIKSFLTGVVLVLVTVSITGCAPTEFSKKELASFASAVEKELNEDTAMVVAQNTLTGPDYLKISRFKWGNDLWFPRTNLQESECNQEDPSIVSCYGVFEGSITLEGCLFQVSASDFPNALKEGKLDLSLISGCDFNNPLTSIDEDYWELIDFSKIPCSAKIQKYTDPFVSLTCSNHRVKRSESWDDRHTNKDYWEIVVWSSPVADDICQAGNPFPTHSQEDLSLIGENWWTSFTVGDGNEEAMLEIQKQLGGSITTVEDYCLSY